MSPSSALQLLLADLFDYAGLFPPAALPMSEAVEEYVHHLAGREAWMVGPFVVPVGRLGEMEAAFGNRPARITLLPSNLTEDLAAFRALQQRTDGRFTLAALEFRFPADALNTLEDAQAVLAGVVRSLDAPGSVPVYLEIPRPFSEIQLHHYFHAISERKDLTFRGKIRCGGDSIAAYPSAQELAAFIHAAARAGCAFKATAGLHHPFPQPDPATGATMHGFVNVFTAAIFSRIHELPVDVLITIMEEHNPDAFSISNSHIGWGQWSATAAQTASVRRDFAVGIGSCSIHEPVHDLTSLGLYSP